MAEIQATMQGNFTIVDTLLSNDDCLRIKQLSGRQGDNRRVVDLALKIGKLPLNLSGKKVSIRLKDAEGVVKEISRVHDLRSAAAGLISLEVSTEVYQAPGDTQAGFIRITDNNDTVLSSVNIVFQVFEDQTTVSAEASTIYLDAVDQTIEEVNKKFEPLNANLADNKQKVSDLAETVNNYESIISKNYPSDKLQTMSLSMTYNENDPDRYLKVLKRYTDVAQSITLVNMVNISSDTASDVTSSSESILQQAITDAKTLGYKIAMIKPHVGPNRNDGFAKFKYKPDNVDNFFAQYREMLLLQAKLAVNNSIPVLCIATELNQLINPTYMPKWQAIVQEIRDTYPTLKLNVAVAGAYDETQQTIYSLTDYVGVNWYPEYTYQLIKNAEDIPADDELSQGLLNYHSNDSENPEGLPDLNAFTAASQKYQKPIWFTETGVMPQTDGLNQLLTEHSQDNEMYEISAAALRVFFNNLVPNAEVVGISWWHGQEPFNLAPIDTSSAKTIAEQTWQMLERKYNTNGQIN